MQKLKEAKILAKKIEILKKENKKSALITVIQKTGSAYRSEGAKFLVTEDKEQICGISGGCLEKGLVHIALQVIETQKPVIEIADLQDSATWGMWLGCPGEVKILIEPVIYDDILYRWIKCIKDKEKFVFVKNINTLEKGIYTKKDHTGSYIGDPDVIYKKLNSYNENSELIGDTFYDTVLIYPPIVIFGKGEEVFYLKKVAEIIGFKVINPDPVENIKIPDDSFVIIANHHIKLDRISLKKALSSNACYIGLISSLKRFEKVSENLEIDDRVYVPAGLDIGGEFPDEVVLSIISEIISVFNHKTGLSLSKVKGIKNTRRV